MTISSRPCLDRHGIGLAGADRRTFSLVERAALSVAIAVACVLIRVTEGDHRSHEQW